MTKKIRTSSLLAMVVIALILSFFAWGNQSSYAASGFATAPDPVYDLPGDHRFHAGDFYTNDDFHEWHYFTFLGKDTDTGDDISLFWCIFQAGYNESTKRPYNVTIFAHHNEKTGKFYSAMDRIGGEFKSSGLDPSDPNFSFNYEAGTDLAGWATGYDYKNETWKFSGYSKDKRFHLFKDNDPYKFEATLELEKPGYIPSAYFGLEAIGYVPGYRQNPQTMWGLTKYVLAPNSKTKGTLVIDGKTVNFEGTSWMEHQWGNFDKVEKAKYFWGYMRLNDGRIFTWRQYYKTPGFGEYDEGMTRFLLINPDGTLEYAFGPSFVYTPTKFWESPLSGTKFPWWGEMKTPIGKFYFGPKWPSQESATFSWPSAFIEGVGYIRKYPDGPIVGKGFVEIVDAPAGSQAPIVFPDKDLKMKINEMNR